MDSVKYSYETPGGMVGERSFTLSAKQVTTLFDNQGAGTTRTGMTGNMPSWSLGTQLPASDDALEVQVLVTSTTDGATMYGSSIRTVMTVGHKTSTFTLQDVADGKVGFYCAGSQEAPTFTATASFQASGRTVTSDAKSSIVAFRSTGSDGTGGVLLFGDGLGNGGNFGFSSVKSGHGGRSADVLTGTSSSDIILGDGSGGGEGGRAGTSGDSRALQGFAGGGVTPSRQALRMTSCLGMDSMALDTVPVSLEPSSRAAMAVGGTPAAVQVVMG